MGPLIPVGMAVGSAIASHYSKKSLLKQAKQLTPAEQAAQTGATNTANYLNEQGAGLIGEGRGHLNQAGDYWSRLLGGNRAMAAQATAAPRAQLTDVYRGALQSLEHSGVRGASRDRATAELTRDRASRIAGLTTGVQPMAAQQVAGVGSTQLGQGARMPAEAGNIFSSLLGQGARTREFGTQMAVYGDANQQNQMAQVGGSLYDAFSQWQGNRGTSGGGKLGSRNIGSTGGGPIGRNPLGLMPVPRQGGN